MTRAALLALAVCAVVVAFDLRFPLGFKLTLCREKTMDFPVSRKGELPRVTEKVPYEACSAWHI